jgi:membrane-bound lytic murein transglycosylase A
MEGAAAQCPRLLAASHRCLAFADRAAAPPIQLRLGSLRSLRLRILPPQGGKRVLFVAALVLTACAPIEQAPGPHLRVLSSLPGWSEDLSFQAYPALLESCGVIERLSSDQALGVGAPPTAWRAGCDAITGLKAALVSDTDVALRRTMEAHFIALDPGAGSNALVTGYYEPELKGSRTQDAAHPFPLYRLPPNPTAFDRAEIDGGALQGQGLELLWVNDRVEAFFLHVQGSGRVRLDSGEVVRVGFAGTNEREYASIGKAMVDAGIMTKEEASLQTIRAYLNAHPEEIDSWLHRNPRYVFFKEAPADPDLGPIGALNVPLTPGRSIAVDPAFVALGLPVWLDTTEPRTNAPLRRLVVAQDKGSAIKGPGRIDLFWGAGDEAEAMAGPMRQQGTYWVIVPRAVGERWLAQQAGS